MIWGIGSGKKEKDGKGRCGRLDLGDPGFRQELLWTIIQNAPVAYVITDGSYKVRFANNHLLRLRGVGLDDVLGEVCYNVVNGGVPCPICLVKKAIETGEGHRLLRKDVMQDGSVIYTDDFAVPIKVDGEKGLILEALVDRTVEMQIKEKTNAIFMEVIRSMIRLLEKKDPYTCQHCREVSAISSRLTRYMGLGDGAVFNAMLGGLLHDLGKLHVPDAVLSKNGRLEGWEIDAIREHPIFTYLILPDLVPFKTIREIAISHHERWDGKGYPSAMAGEDIPMEARIAAVADTYSAMTSDRPYRRGMDHGTAMAEIKGHSGTQFDPRVVEQFVRMVEEQGLDKASLTAPDETTAFVQRLRTSRHVQRKISRAAGAVGGRGQGCLTESDVRGFAESASFVNAIMDSAPASYVVIDESLNILYASDDFARARGRAAEDLCMEKCFDAIGGKAAYCFEVKGGRIRCPAVRAFCTGRQQYALIQEEISGRTHYHGTYSVPMTLRGAGGGTIACCLNILFDRTKEKLAQNELEDDLRRIVDTLYNFITELAPGVTGNIDGISDAAIGFNDYLNKVRDDLSEILAAGDPG